MNSCTRYVSRTVWGIKHRKLSSVPRAEQNLGDQKFIVDREVEAILTPWLIWEDRNFKQQEI